MALEMVGWKEQSSANGCVGSYAIHAVRECHRAPCKRSID